MGGDVNDPRTSEAVAANSSKLSSAQAQAELTRLRQQMDLLHQVHLDLVTAFDSRQVLRTALARSLQMVGAARGSIMIFDDKARVLKIMMYYYEGWEQYVVEQERIFPLDEPSVARWVLQNNKAYLCQNTDEDPLYNPRLSSESRKAMLSVPIPSGDIAIGVINAGSDRVDFFTDEHRKILADLAGAVGFAVERASLIEALKDLASAMGDREELLGAIAGGVTQLVHVPACLVWLRDAKSESLAIATGIGIDKDNAATFQLDSADPFVKACLDTFRSEKQLLYAAHVQEIEGPHATTAQGLDLVSVLAVPLLVGDELLGLIGAYSREPRQFSAWSRQLLVTFSEQAATALENTRLVDMQKERLILLKAEQQRLRKIRLGMESALDLETVLKLILHEGIMKGLAPKTVSANIMLCDRTENLLRMTTLEAPKMSDEEARLKQSETVFRPGEGIAGRVFVSKRPYNCSNIREDSKARKIEFDPKKQALLSVPILSGEVAIGVLNADGGEVGCFMEDNVESLTTLADHAAIAIERVTLLESLKELNESVSSEERLAERVAKGVCDLLHVTGTLVWLPRGEHGELIVAGSEGSNWDAVTEWQLETDSPFLQKCLQFFKNRREPLITEDAGQDPEFPYRHAAGSLGIISMLTIPLLTDLGLQGLITAYSDELRHFTARQCDVVITFAEQAAIAIEDANLHRETEQRLQVMEAVREMTSYVVAQAELSTVLQSMVVRAAELLDGRGGLVYLFNEATQELEVAVSHGLGKDYRGSTLMRGEGLGGKVYELRRPDIVDDYGTWSGRSLKWDQEGITAIIAAPLMQEDVSIGVIEVMDDKEKRKFTQYDLELLELFAQHLSLAIDRAQRLEEQLVAEAVAWMGIYGSYVSHDAVQKGGAIRYQLEILDRLLSALPWDMDTESVKEQVEKALEHIDAAASWIQSMPITRPIASDSELAESVLIDEALAEQLTRRCTLRRDVELELDLRCDMLRARIDGEWLKTALDKLITNALEMMPKGGTLSASSRRQDGVVEITLTDTGAGISPKILPYFLKGRVPKEDSEVGTGTGMGVLIAKFIFKQHHGDLRLLWTREGEGTALSITLPVAKE